MATERYDAIVIGGGTMGSAAAWELGKRGLKALVLEQFDHVHDRGAHGGKTRVFRHAYAESPDYVPLVRRADALFQELEAETGDRVLVRCGGLEMAAPGYTHARDARRSADQHGIAYEWLTPDEGRRRWPTVAIPDGWDVLWSPDAGFVLTEPALRGMMAGGVRRGLELREREPALEWQADGESVHVRTAAGTYHADRLIVSAGPWAGLLLADLGLPLRVLRKVLFWLAVEEAEPYAPERFPVFIADTGLGQIYGFPVIDEDGLKIADHAGGEPTTADTVARTVRPGEGDNVREIATALFRGVTDRVTQTAVCLYTMTPDGHFVVDRHPAHPNVVVAAGFSGHGFKFAPAIGELAVALAFDQAAVPPPILAIDRLLVPAAD